MNKFIMRILAIPRSLLLNILFLGIKDGIKLPILFSNNTKIKGIRRGAIIVDREKNFAKIQIGFGGSEGVFANRKSYIIIGKKGKVIFRGKAAIGQGSSIRVDSGVCEFGDRFSCNKNCFVSCSYGIIFGDDVLLGWNVNVRDSDGHLIMKESIKKPNCKSVVIGNRVWVASYVDILKGVKIYDGCVVAYRSCVVNSIEKENSIIAGYPAVVVQENILWER